MLISTQINIFKNNRTFLKFEILFYGNRHFQKCDFRKIWKVVLSCGQRAYTKRLLRQFPLRLIFYKIIQPFKLGSIS